MLQVCRTCLHQIADASFVNLTSSTKSAELKRQLAFCVPEMATNLVSEPIMCIPCTTALHSAYVFKNQCLQTEERIRNYLETKNMGINLLDIFETPVEETSSPNNDSQEVYIKEEYTLDLEPDSSEAKYDLETQENVEFIPPPENSIAEDLNLHQQQFKEIIKKKSKHYRPQIDKPHKCDKCSFSTADRSTLNKHRSVHSDERPHQCTLCKYRTKRKDALTLHMKIHKDEKPYSCPECKYSAITKQRLRIHVMVAHLELKPYKCERCDFSAAERGTVVKHMLTHTDVKPFQCKLCNFCTKRKYTLKKHMLSHGVE